MSLITTTFEKKSYRLVNSVNADGCTDISDVSFIGYDMFEDYPTATDTQDAPAYIEHLYLGAPGP